MDPTKSQDSQGIAPSRTLQLLLTVCKVVYSAGVLIQSLPNSPDTIIPRINEEVKKR
jgi:hypothetical protein